ncbi:hypothetical protein FQN53_003026 [Emmonsiellopsis sp. PD_33]|nr:hypothetical protein FQN53_003026 [Emmonsiellopsis sp. PD_33]
MASPPLKKSTVFRARGVPSDVSDSEFISFLERNLLEEERTIVEFSVALVPSPYGDESQNALVEVQGVIPQFLSELNRDPLRELQLNMDGGDINIDRHFHGFTQLYTTQPEYGVSADIIAITGLDGHAFGSWRGRGKLRRMWLRDFLSQDLPRCRTMIYGYNSKLATHGVDTIMDYGRMFLEEIKQVRDTAECIIQAAHTNGDDHPTISSLLRATYGFLLFGIPHKGLVIDDIKRMLGEDNSHPRLSLLQQINVKSDHLFFQLAEFKNLIRDRKVISFYETKQTRRLEFNAENQSWGRTGEFMTAVDADSALLHLPDHMENKIPLDDDHSNIVKFDSKTTQGYRIAIKNLRQFERYAPKVVLGRFSAEQPLPGPNQPPLIKASSTVPFRRDRLFVGRQDIISRVESIIDDTLIHNRVALVGMGGVGKSQIAIEFAYRCRERFPDTWVFWIHGGSGVRFEEGYKNIAQKVRLLDPAKQETNILQLVYNWLSDEANGRWIMIIDNADDESVFFNLPDGSGTYDNLERPDHTQNSLLDFIPQSPNGSIVITSRNRNAAYKLAGNDSEIIDIKQMNQEETLVLLRNKLKSNIDDAQAVELLEELDYMPLAITQAAAYIRQRTPRITVSKYLDDLRQSDSVRASLLKYDVGDDRRDGEASNSIIATWHMSFEHIRKARPQATWLLSLMSFFDRHDIPEYLLKNNYHPVDSTEYMEEKPRTTSRLRSRLKSLFGRHSIVDSHQTYTHEQDEDERLTEPLDTDFEEDIHTLRNYSLVTNMKESTFEMHRLVQFSMKKWLALNNEQEHWKERYIAIIREAFPLGKYENWGICQPLFPHAAVIQTYRPVRDMYLEKWADILYKAAVYTFEKHDFDMAAKMSEQSLEARKQVLGRRHRQLIPVLVVQARICIQWDQLDKAEDLLAGQAMKIAKRSMKEDEIFKSHPSLMGSLAEVYFLQGKHKKAEDMNRKGVEIIMREFGEESLHTLTRMRNLAVMYHRQEKLDEAEELQRQVLETERRVLSNKHPVVLTSLYNLSSILYEQGRRDDALKLMTECVELSAEVLGDDHPDTVEHVSFLCDLQEDVLRGSQEDSQEDSVSPPEVSRSKTW